MAVLITYDLPKPGQNYEALYEAIKGLGDHIHPFESVWIVDTNLPVGEIVANIEDHFDANDKFLITTLGNIGYGGVEGYDLDWLMKTMSL